jgi:hypothetical protein
MNFLSQHSTCIFSIRLFLNNAYGTIILQASPSKYLIKYERVKNYKQCVMPSSFLQACPSKYLILYECVKNYISLNMNLLKITNDVL